MKQAPVTRATLGRLPFYLQYLRTNPGNPQGYVSATTIAKALGLGEVLVRKDLNAVSGAGKPRTGYVACELRRTLEDILSYNQRYSAVIVGAGNLGRALLHYDGFSEYGLHIAAAFDSDPQKVSPDGLKPVYPLHELASYTRENHIQIGILAVPAEAAQAVCNLMIESGITAIWNFAAVSLEVPESVVCQQENLALSLAYLVRQLDAAEIADLANA